MTRALSTPPVIASGSLAGSPQPVLTAADGTRRSAAVHDDGRHDMHLHARVLGD
jgi:hypothetical protein